MWLSEFPFWPLLRAAVAGQAFQLWSLRLALVLCQLGLGLIAVPAQSVGNQSKLAVCVCVKAGKLSVDRAKTQAQADFFAPSEEFNARLSPRLKSAKLIEQLFDELDAALAQMDFVYRYGLQGAEQDQEPNDKLTQELRSFTGKGSADCWQSFRAKYAEWVQAGAQAGQTRTPLERVFTGAEMLSKLDTSATPLIFSIPRTPPRPWNAEQGSLRLRVADPIGNLDEISLEFSGKPADAVATQQRRAEIKTLLAALQGQLWRHKAITARIEDYYSQRGLMAQATISPAVAQPRSLVISESPRLSQFFFPFKFPLEAAALAQIEKLAYLLLPEVEFRQFVRNPAALLTDATLKAKDEQGNDVILKNRVKLAYDQLGRAPGTEPYLNQFAFQVMQLQLTQLGFQAAQQPRTTDDVRYVDLELVALTPDSGAAQAPGNAPPPVAPTANPQGVLGAATGDALARNAFAAPVSVNSTGTLTSEMSSETTAEVNPPPSAPPSAPDELRQTLEGWRPKEKKNYAGFGLDYRPGQKLRAFGLYQRSLPGQGSLSLQLGGQESALGQVSYSADYVLFHRLKRRLALQFTGGSDVQANRILAGALTDERRSGGLIRAELELFRDWGGNLLRLALEARRDTVRLSRDGSLLSKLNLTTLDFGGFYLFERNEAQYPKRLRLEPRVRFGLGLARTEPRFTAFQLAGNYHQHLPRLLEADISGQFAQASRGTPLVELPSFGGETMVRGFRRDDALGRRVWSLQSELWLPVPGLSRSAEGFGRFLRRQVRLAGFADLGGAAQTFASQPGTRFGPGLGARVVFFPVVIKLDWAYGLGDAAVGRGRGRFYFSVGTNLPF